jgi:hypothetical protein
VGLHANGVESMHFITAVWWNIVAFLGTSVYNCTAIDSLGWAINTTLILDI